MAKPRGASSRSRSRKGQDLRRHIVARAAVDPEFRKQLFSNPEKVFGEELSKADAAALKRIKKMIPSLEGMVTSLAGEVLCGGGGGCGGLA